LKEFVNDAAIELASRIETRSRLCWKPPARKAANSNPLVSTASDSCALSTPPITLAPLSRAPFMSRVI
jgi:hypothetical protein